MMTQDYEKRKQALGSDQMYCSYCASIMKKEADVCPTCGGRPKARFQQNQFSDGGQARQSQGGMQQNQGNKDKPFLQDNQDKSMQQNQSSDRNAESRQNQGSMQQHNQADKDKQGQRNQGKAEQNQNDMSRQGNREGMQQQEEMKNDR